MHHNYGACAPGPETHNHWATCCNDWQVQAPQSRCTAAREASAVGSPWTTTRVAPTHNSCREEAHAARKTQLQPKINNTIKILKARKILFHTHTHTHTHTHKIESTPSFFPIVSAIRYALKRIFRQASLSWHFQRRLVYSPLLHPPLTIHPKVRSSFKIWPVRSEGTRRRMLWKFCDGSFMLI